jgi:phage terminase large subunit
MDAREILALGLDPTRILRAQGITPDPWQEDLLFSNAQHILLNCSRGAGKSRTTSALAVHHALTTPKSTTLLVSRAMRQALELYRYCSQAFKALGWPIPPTETETKSQVELANGARIISVPGKEANIRSIQGVSLLVIDEAARVPDDLYASVRPMTATTNGRIIALSTPYGQRGWWWREWEDADAGWVRFRVPYQRCPRISEAFIENERRSLGEQWVEQEYECSFTALEGLVYPEFPDAVYAIGLPPPGGEKVGGIDFGYRNPCAAVWGYLDRDDVLWIEKEFYRRETSLHQIAQALKEKAPGTMWYADPAGAREIQELRIAGLKIRKGDNDVPTGVAAVAARLQTGRLKVRETTCENLIGEAKLYRREGNSEIPLKENDHALDALRYLVSRIDARYMARLRKERHPEGREDGQGGETPEEAAERRDESNELVHGIKPQQWLSLDNEALWEAV